MSDNNVQNWNSRIENSSRSTFFKSIVIFNFQFYLKCNKGTTLTAALSRLMLSSHNLFIETGRWHHPHCIPREDRMCITCNTIEDKYLFVIACSIFTDHRKRYISKYYWTNPSMYRLKQFFDCTNVSKLRKYTTPFIIISYNCCIPVIMYIYIIN